MGSSETGSWRPVNRTWLPQIDPTRLEEIKLEAQIRRFCLTMPRWC